MNPPQLFPLPNPQDFAAAIGPAFPYLCTIKAPLDGSGDQDQYGAPHGPAERQYVNLAGHESIQCSSAPEGGTTATSSKEKRSVEFTQDVDLFEVVLNGYYPLIKKTHQAEVTDPNTSEVSTYEVQGVNWDVYKILTHLHCRTLTI